MKIYNFTGIKSTELINITSSEDNGKELILCSTALDGIERGDTLLLDRPYFKCVPFKVEGVRYIAEKPEYKTVYAKKIEEQLGGCQAKLRLRFRRAK